MRGWQYRLWTEWTPHRSFADAPRAPHAGTPTSRAAARSIEPSISGRKMSILRFIARHGEHGATDSEIQTALGLPSHSETPRRLELVRAGLVRDSGRTRPTESGRAATVWIATDAGEAAAR